MVRLYRKGIIKDWGSSWFPTIREALNYEEASGEMKNPDETAIGIMRLSRESFNRYFESRGIGCRAKSEEAFLNSGSLIKYMPVETLMRYLEDIDTCRIFGDAEAIQRLGFP